MPHAKSPWSYIGAVYICTSIVVAKMQTGVQKKVPAQSPVGLDAHSLHSPLAPPDWPLQTYMNQLSDTILLAERVLLFALGFTLGVGAQPVSVMFALFQELKLKVPRDPREGLEMVPEPVAQKVVNFLNDW